MEHAQYPIINIRKHSIFSIVSKNTLKMMGDFAFVRHSVIQSSDIFDGIIK